MAEQKWEPTIGIGGDVCGSGYTPPHIPPSSPPEPPKKQKKDSDSESGSTKRKGVP